ncbi:MAG TPA: UDP-N-acetylmuramoyl-tripeptide--D-alanyl-D-alanine ligase [Candidatus Saccharimonadales bacterium]|jgi:UDP-N-acetylmuramoyl-tripeptide--D-alanyl-D-alanine ligase
MFLRSILDLYSFRLPATLVTSLSRRRYSGWRLLYWFWHTTRFQTERELTEAERPLAVLLGLGVLGQLAFGVGFVVQWVRYGTAGSWEFGLALLLSYPLVWAHALVVLAWLWNLAWEVLHPKKAARAAVCTILEMQVRQLRRRHNFKVVAVAGSMGKTSTKLAVAQLLEHSGLRVRYQTGNYNDRVTVPLVFFGLSEPSLYNVFAWLKTYGASQSEIALPYPYDVVVVEIGTDGPGQIAEYAYLKPDVAVVTGVSEEHMEFFGTLERVAAEELTVFDYSTQVLVNGDDIPGEFLAGRDFAEYSLVSEQAQYFGTASSKGLQGQKLDVKLPHGSLTADINFLGRQGAKITLAAAAVADMLGIKRVAITKGLAELQPFSGRMQILNGVKKTTLIDDTYNAAPLTIKAALDVLYTARTGQRIAILGSMNEMGGYAREAHEEVGAYCDPKKLDVVVTIGEDAKKWLAPVARERGCTVHSFLSPYEAGEYVSGKLQKGGVVLAKGSQNGVFAEESIKPLLADPGDAARLVRQSPYWLTKKQQQFGS